MADGPDFLAVLLQLVKIIIDGLHSNFTLPAF